MASDGQGGVRGGANLEKESLPTGLQSLIMEKESLLTVLRSLIMEKESLPTGLQGLIMMSSFAATDSPSP